MIQLYHYVHCPFCVRVRMALGHLKMPYESLVLPYDDEKTPLDLCQKKMLPIVKWDDGSTQNESLEIIERLDKENLLQMELLKDDKKREELEHLLDRFSKPIHNLCMPYWIWTPEFNDSSREYFRSKKEKKRGPLKELIGRKVEFFKELEPIINDLLMELDPYYKSPFMTIFDIMIASHLWGMYIFPEYQFKKGVHAYLQDIKNQCAFDYHRDFFSSSNLVKV
jgi:glutaredoxin 2